MNATDQVRIQWYRPDGTLSTTYTYTPSGVERDGFYQWVLPSSVWSTETGVWQVALVVNNQVINESSFTVTGGAGLPSLRVTQGDTTGTYILDNRTTPISFGTVAQGAGPPQLTFTVQNVGTAQLLLANPLLSQPDFSFVGAFPTSIAPGATASFTVQLNTANVGAQFSGLTFTTNVGAESTFSFNLTGTVTGTVGSNVPTVALPNPAAVFDPRLGPVVLDAGVALSDGSPGSLSTGALTVSIESGGTTGDQLAIHNQGTGANQVSVSGSNVLFSGTVIGTYTGGDNLNPLIITFNAASTLAAAQAVCLRNHHLQHHSQH